MRSYESDILETLALQEAVQTAPLTGLGGHGSRIACIQSGGWQSEVIRGMDGIEIAQTIEILRQLMSKPGLAAIFIPHTAIINGDIINRICRESGLDKLIIWETA